MARGNMLLVLTGVLAMFLVGCSQQGTEEQVVLESLARFPADSPEGLVETSTAEYDAEMSADGQGSLRILAAEPMTVALYETGDLDVERAKLIYRAQLRCEDLDGAAYLEMWCSFGEEDEYFSRGIESPISGTIEWTPREVPFFLEAGQNPTNVRLNIVIDGTGTVWVDDLQVLRGTLP